MAWAPHRRVRYPRVTLHLYVLRQLLMGFTIALFGTAFTVFPVLAVSAVHRLSGVGIGAVLGYLPLVGMDILPFLVPMAFLLAVVATFGRFSVDNEWTAIRSAGIHPMRTLLMPALVAIVLGGVTFWLMSEVRPRWKDAQYDYRNSAIKEAFQSLAAGRTELVFGDFYLNSGSREGNTFYDAVLEVPRGEGEEPIVIIADAANFGFDRSNDGSATLEDDLLRIEFAGARTVKDDEYMAMEYPVLRLPLDELLPKRKPSKNVARFRTSGALRAALKADDIEPVDERRFNYEVHSRYALSACFLVFLSIGVPAGLRRRSGTQLGALASAVSFAFIYHVLSLNLGKETAHSGSVDPVLAAWGANIVLLTFGLIALRRVAWK